LNSNSSATDIPDIERALVLQGRGSLGAYEAGAYKALYEWLSEKDEKVKPRKGSQIDDILSYLDTKKVGDIVHLQVFRDNKVEDVSITLGPGQNLQQGPSPTNPPLPPDSNMSQPSPMPPGSSNNPLDEFYESCINIAGKDLCDRLFGKVIVFL
jgi:hypothetical protein